MLLPNAGYDLVEAVQAACDKAMAAAASSSSSTYRYRLHATSDTLGQVRAGSQRSRYSCRHSSVTTLRRNTEIG
jgi:hypothetical protein